MRACRFGFAKGFDFSAAENLGKIRLLNQKKERFSSLKLEGWV